jgi:flagellar hook-length control protein FliK
MLTKPAAQSAAANAPQAPAAQHGQAQPQAPDALMAAAPVQAQQAQTAHPINGSLHIGPQADAVAQPNIDALAVNIAAKSKDGEKHFDIRLDPAELGRVDVKLSIDDAGKTQASLTAEKPQTLELLQRDRHTLERALRDAGLDLTGGGLNFSLKGQERDANTGSQPRGRGLSVTAIAETNAVNAAQSLSRIASADSRLDIRV